MVTAGKRPVFIFICQIFLFTTFPLSAYFDLESVAQDVVRDTQQIFIAQHPHAFNPSIVRWRGHLVLSFREIDEDDTSTHPVHYSAGISRIGLTRLNDNFEPIGSPQILQLNPNDEESIITCRAEDARLLTVGDRLFMVYSDNRNPIVTEGGFRMYVAELDFDGDLFTITDLQKLSEFEGVHSERREKNWVPFNYKDNLLFAYSLKPHKILHHFLGTRKCESFAYSNSIFSWYCGELRGGTPALLIDEHRYLAFFHSSIKLMTQQSHGQEVLHYFIGAYLFNSEPPFEITHISDEPIIGKKFYNGKDYEPYWGPVRVVFPCGYIFDESHIWLLYGRQDHEIWVAKIEKKELLGRLVPTVPDDYEGDF